MHIHIQPRSCANLFMVSFKLQCSFLKTTTHVCEYITLRGEEKKNVNTLMHKVIHFDLSLNDSANFTLTLYKIFPLPPQESAALLFISTNPHTQKLCKIVSTKMQIPLT